MTVHKVGAVILAAGGSVRFGADKRQLRVPTGERLLDYTVERCLSAVSDCLVVVDSVTEQSHFTRQGIPAVIAEQAVDGMGYSLARGVKEAVRLHWSALLVCLADMPLIQAESYRRVADALQEYSIVVPTYEGNPGHPVGFQSIHYPALMQLKGDRGGRSVVQTQKKSCFYLSLSDPGIVQDIDTAADWQQIKETLGGC